MFKWASVLVFVFAVSYIAENEALEVEMEVSNSNMGQELHGTIFQLLASATMKKEPNMKRFLLKKLRRQDKNYSWDVEIVPHKNRSRPGQVYADIRINNEMIHVFGRNSKIAQRAGDDSAIQQRFQFDEAEAMEFDDDDAVESDDDDAVESDDDDVVESDDD